MIQIDLELMIFLFQKILKGKLHAMSHQQSSKAFVEMTLEVDLTAMKGSPLDQESPPSITTDEDSQQSLPAQQNSCTFAGQPEFTIMSEPNESENEDDTNEDRPKINLDARTSKLSFRCEVCSKVFYKRSRLVSHLVTHSEQKDHICSVCGKGFKNKPQLIRHSNTHSAVPNFCCNICGRGFKHNDVAKHIRRWHSGPRKSNRGGVPNPDAPNNGQIPIQQRKKKRSQHIAQRSTHLLPQSLHQLSQQSVCAEPDQHSLVECQLSQQEVVQAEPQQRAFLSEPKNEERQKVAVLQHQGAHSHDLSVCTVNSFHPNNLQDNSSSPPLVRKSGLNFPSFFCVLKTIS